MSDEAIQATAENLRADFLNATTTHQRWKVLNRAIEWAVAASENAELLRQSVSAPATYTCHGRADFDVPLSVTRLSGYAEEGFVYGPGAQTLMGEKSTTEERQQFFGQAFDDPLIVNNVTHPDDTQQGLREYAAPAITVPGQNYVIRVSGDTTVRRTGGLARDTNDDYPPKCENPT